MQRGQDIELFTFEVETTAAGQRLDAFLGAQLESSNVSREKIKKAIREGLCRLDGQTVDKPNFKLRPGQQIELTFAMSSLSEALLAKVALAEGASLAVVYEDEWLAVINKPAGLTVHPCPSCTEETLVHRLLSRFPQLGASALTGQDGFRPGIVHRLDKDTSGLMVVALREEARLRLVETFAEREVTKIYWALVKGVPKTPTGTIDAPIGRHPTLKTRMAVTDHGKPALSEWAVCLADPLKRFALLKVTIHTGRTHQIRVHMAHLGHPLLGDRVYGQGPAQRSKAIPRQMLHAGLLAFAHPFSGERVCCTSPPPSDMLAAALQLRRGLRQLVVTGGAGVGKSALLDLLREAGLPVWRADEAVTRQYQPGAEAWSVLLQRYGDRFISNSHTPVDKQLLAAELMRNADFKNEVETLVHRLVRHELDVFWANAEQEGRALAVAEIPLWFENGWGTRHDPADPHRPLVIGVGCTDDERRRRLQTSRGWTTERIEAVDAWQWPLEKKLGKCDFVIENNGSLDDLRKQTESLLQTIEQLVTAQDASFKTQWNQAASLLTSVSCETQKNTELRTH